MIPSYITIQNDLTLSIPADPHISRTLNTQYFHGKVFHSDLMESRYSRDFVLPVGPSAKLISHMIIPGKHASVLDLGCGCGVLAILAAKHASSVLATDINPRALELTNLNAEINGVTNVRTLQGSYFEPLQDRKFDLILANIPYVISPKNRYLYRDTTSSDGSDSLGLLAEIPSHLHSNGFAHINLNWAYSVGQNPWQPVLKILRGAGVDSMLFMASTFTPEEYAGFWLVGEEDVNSAAGRRIVSEQVDWYRAKRMELFAFGHLILRSRAASKNWFTIFHMDSEIQENVGEQVEHLFEVQDHLEACERGEELLDAAFLQNRVQIISSDAENAIVAGLSDFKFKVRIHTVTANALHHFDGQVTAQQALAKSAYEIPTSKYLHDLRLLMQFGMIKMK